MLQRPRDLLPTYDLSPLSCSPSYCRPHYHSQPQLDASHGLVVAQLQLVHSNHINSFNSLDSTWNATKADLVARWEKVNIIRRLHRFKRSMVKKSTTLKNSITKSHISGPTSAGGPQSGIGRVVLCPGQVQTEDSLVAEDTESLNGGFEQCLAEFQTRTEYLNSKNDGYKPVDLSMESKRTAGAAQQSGHCQLNHEGERRLTPDQYVAIKKQEAIELVMAKFNRWLDKRLAIISYTYEASEASGNSASGSGGTESGNGSSGQGQSSRSSRSKRRLSGDDQDNSSAGGDDNDPNRGGNKRAKTDNEQEQKFACPFFKHNAKAHCKNRSCAGPGWTTLHRLKEHLYRVHRLPKHTCPRCNAAFEDARDQHEHLRADVLCEKLDVVPMLQGIDEATETVLRARKKTGMTDEQRWNDIYMILFPNANKKALPSPYYDGNDSCGLTERAEWRRAKKQIQKKLPKIVQKKVERSFEKVGADLLTGLPDIIRDGLLEIFKDLPNDERSPTVSPAATPRAPTPNIFAAGEQSAVNTDGAKDPTLELPCFDSDMTFLFGGLDDLVDFTQFDFGSSAECIDRGSDSGYASTGTGRDCLVETGV
ncbi:hypothetical protein F4821DRAFT_243298 [Hypoxylon rubiginosum]|uniref:Uncharacterized protein n=1 Tax=Hypoxylon rubiginosum TaxID=110542 RepID=A0ACC0CVD2_9PEZI|nr:hypothetical protein F4821DRAFT_243298 [Hypoxylon rubiginosum]